MKFEEWCEDDTQFEFPLKLDEFGNPIKEPKYLFTSLDGAQNFVLSKSEAIFFLGVKMGKIRKAINEGTSLQGYYIDELEE